MLPQGIITIQSGITLVADGIVANEGFCELKIKEHQSQMTTVLTS